MIEKRSAAETLSEILSVNIEALEKYPDKIAAPITHSIGLLITALKGIDAAALEGASALVVLAWDAAWKAGAARAVVQNKPLLKRGITAIKGDKKTAAKVHADAEELHKKARERYDFHDAKHPTAGRKGLCQAVAEDLDGVLKWQTIARLIPDPKRRRGRGRPRKH